MILQNWWFTTLLGIEDPIEPPLVGDRKADVVIIGAGAAGLSSAYALMNSGVKVVVLERNICGGSSSGKSAGFLTPDSELELAQLERRFGNAGAAELWNVATRGVEMMAERVREHHIPCDLQVQDSLFLGNGKSGWEAVQDEVRSREALGFEQEQLDAQAVRSLIGSSAYSGAVRYKGTYGINALLYCQGMKKVLKEHGVVIHEASEVIGWKEHTVRTHLGSVNADRIIFCADKLSPQLSLHAENIFHAQTFLSISEPLGDDAARALFPSERFQCWDSDLVYSYFRMTGDGRLLLGGGDMLTTFAKNDVNSSRVIDQVISGFKKNFPQLRGLRFIQYWPGRIDTTRDLIPTVINEERTPWIHFVLGCVGLPWATFCGDLVARQATGRSGPMDETCYHYFRPDRKFLVPLWLERIIGKQIVFSLNNGWAKYYQVDVH
ncbi:MAG: FAD-binding oxidoreductase [Flavobacteriales bacterium]|nr:FAD-binding oxidoreductase [Flavobacteriales bacterium]